jgi:hypothetical protein
MAATALRGLDKVTGRLSVALTDSILRFITVSA